jgi:hypothetical protein
MKKQDIEKLVRELREFAECERLASDFAYKKHNAVAASMSHDLNAYKFDEAADALERILKEGIRN